MKKLMRGVLFLFVFIGLIVSDFFLMKWLFGMVPSGNWSGLIKVGLTLLVVWASLVLWGISYLVLNDRE